MSMMVNMTLMQLLLSLDGDICISIRNEAEVLAVKQANDAERKAHENDDTYEVAEYVPDSIYQGVLQDLPFMHFNLLGRKVVGLSVDSNHQYSWLPPLLVIVVAPEKD